MSSKPSRRSHRVAPALAWLATALLLVGLRTPTPVAADPGRNYLPPVDAPVVDPFRAPPSPYGPGNRGLEYATEPGTPVRAVAAGTVTFAGPVARAIHVTVDHHDGLRSTYSYLASARVSVGDVVSQGQVLGASTGRLHFGVRAGDVYLDPSTLFAPPAARVHLVPDGGGAERPDPAVPAGGGGGGSIVSAEALAWAVESGRPTDSWECTPPGYQPSSTPTRRIGVLVGGLGSTSERAAIDDVDLAALGYDPADVVRFSYRGGRIPDVRHGGTGAAIATQPYDAVDTLGDLRKAGDRLAALLTAVSDTTQGAAVDVLAHSQGGIVTRLALAELDQTGRQRGLDSLGVVVTLGSPHQGADLAAAIQWVNTTDAGSEALGVIQWLAGLDIPPDAPAVTQLAPGSALLAELNSRPVPAGVRVVSVGARGDLVVPAHRTHLAGATNVVVSVPGLATDHDRLPGSGAGTREISLALAGLPPTCEDAADRFTDGVTGRTIGVLERAIGLSAALSAALVELL